MYYLQNHCFCIDSVWGGDYLCRHMVTMNSYEDGFEEDWDNCVDESAEKAIQEICDVKREREVFNLKKEVLEWLEKNVKDRKNEGVIEKGWTIPNKEKRLNNQQGLNVFFHRKSDAMAFIKKWSKWKKPIFYCHYFDDIRKELDLNTLKYKKME